MKIFNLNCWLLPPPFSKDNRKRLRRIIKIMKRVNPDIIALQEVWLHKYVGIIKKEMKEYQFFHSKHFLFNKSGLITGTKIKAKHANLKFFPITKNHNLREQIGKKGVHVIALSDKMCFINTQLYAPNNKKEKRITFSQFKFIQGLNGFEKTILVGDLNIDERELELVNNSFDHAKKRETHKERRVIDFILKSKNFKAKIVSEIIKKPVVSDHEIILASMTIK